MQDATDLDVYWPGVLDTVEAVLASERRRIPMLVDLVRYEINPGVQAETVRITTALAERLSNLVDLLSQPTVPGRPQSHGPWPSYIWTTSLMASYLAKDNVNVPGWVTLAVFYRLSARQLQSPIQNKKTTCIALTPQ